jgi:hypothetical protein
MEKELLAQYNDLKGEIRQISKRLDKLMGLRSKNENKREYDLVKATSKYYPYIERNVHIDGFTDERTIKINTAINNEIKVLEERYDKLLKETENIVRFIDRIDDSLVRQIITYRILENYTWREVADSIGGGNTEDSIKKVYYRYMDKK